VGLDYMHGTGHGIGMYLNVHEGPMGISWKVFPNDPGLQEGMFISNGKISTKQTQHLPRVSVLEVLPLPKGWDRTGYSV